LYRVPAFSLNPTQHKPAQGDIRCRIICSRHRRISQRQLPSRQPRCSLLAHVEGVIGTWRPLQHPDWLRPQYIFRDASWIYDLY
jgi:hypothetical protein